MVDDIEAKLAKLESAEVRTRHKDESVEVAFNDALSKAQERAHIIILGILM